MRTERKGQERMNYWQRFWHACFSFCAWLWDKIASFFVEDLSVPEDYARTLRALQKQLGRNISSARPKDPDQALNEKERDRALKNNASQSLLKALNPGAKYRGVSIEISDDNEEDKSKAFHLFKMPQKSSSKELNRGLDTDKCGRGKVVTKWALEHAEGARYQVDDLNIHSSKFSALLQRFFGKQTIQTESMQLVQDAIELEAEWPTTPA
jgi:hypothetical protein